MESHIDFEFKKFTAVCSEKMKTRLPVAGIISTPGRHRNSRRQNHCQCRSSISCRSKWMELNSS